ncbi:ATP-binding protein [Kutzneria sp. NPDC052558]|uniref:ATP-binding protein n=1 Tax=Kutzneria sp. NPDC052558 TaxID=3364121 RepID=UPI0037C701C1
MGREHELAEIGRLLSAGRLLTLLGPGGVGKTRLAVRAAHEAVAVFADGVCMVRLEDLTDPELLPQTVAECLELNDSMKDPIKQVVGFLKNRSVLLVLDNCEHLVDRCAEFIEALLQETASVRVLATSRHVLAVNGEQLLPVPPLAVKGIEAPRSGNWGDAVALFEQRAKASVGKSFATAHERELVTNICFSLDGIPLAIELAVPWLRVITLDEMADRLQDRFRLLAKGNRSSPQRHQTLAGAVDWSYQLCTPDEARLWSRLSVFAGGFTLQAAMAVCVDDGDDVDLLELFSGLTDKSVLIRDKDKGAARYRMLETLRQYGARRLAETGEDVEIQRRHSEFFAAMASRAGAAWLGPDQLQLVADIQQEHANMRGALEFCLRRPADAERAARLAISLEFYWVNCGFFGEGVLWLDRVLALPDLPTDLRVNATWIRVYAATALGDADNAAVMAAENVTRARELGDTVALANALLGQGGSALVQTEYDLAESLYVECLDLYERAGVVNCNVILAYTARGMVAGFSGRLDRTEEMARKAIAISDKHGEQCIRSYALYALALAEWQLGKHDEAQSHTRQGLAIKAKFGDVLGQAMMVELCAWIAATMGDAVVCAKLLGVADRLWLRVGGDAMLDSQTWQVPHANAERVARAALGADEYEAAFAEGAAQAIDLHHAIVFVLGIKAVQQSAGQPAGEQSCGARSFDDSLLTKRETQIAELIAQGTTNRAIAEELRISRRTVEAHVQHILDKLGFDSRTQIGVWVADRRNKLA